MATRWHGTYAHDFPRYNVPKPKLVVNRGDVRRVPPVDPRATKSKDWISESRSTTGAFDMGTGLECRARSAPAGPRWAPRKLLPANWTTSKWNSTYRTGSGSSPSSFKRALSRAEMDIALEKSVASRPCQPVLQKETDGSTPTSTMREMGSWDLHTGQACKKESQTNRFKGRNMSETWFTHPDNPVPPAVSTYADMTDQSQFQPIIEHHHLSKDDLRGIAHMDWLMKHEKATRQHRATLKKNGQLDNRASTASRTASRTGSFDSSAAPSSATMSSHALSLQRGTAKCRPHSVPALLTLKRIRH